MTHYPGRALVAGLLLGLGVAAMLITYSFLPFGTLTLAIPIVLFPGLIMLLAYFGPSRTERTVRVSRDAPPGS